MSFLTDLDRSFRALSRSFIDHVQIDATTKQVVSQPITSNMEEQSTEQQQSIYQHSVIGGEMMTCYESYWNEMRKRTSLLGKASQNVELGMQQLCDYWYNLHTSWTNLSKELVLLQPMTQSIQTITHDLQQVATRLQQLEQVLDLVSEQRERDTIAAWERKRTVDAENLNKEKQRELEELERAFIAEDKERALLEAQVQARALKQQQQAEQQAKKEAEQQAKKQAKEAEQAAKSALKQANAAAKLAQQQAEKAAAQAKKQATTNPSKSTATLPPTEPITPEQVVAQLVANSNTTSPDKPNTSIDTKLDHEQPTHSTATPTPAPTTSTAAVTATASAAPASAENASSSSSASSSAQNTEPSTSTSTSTTPSTSNADEPDSSTDTDTSSTTSSETSTTATTAPSGGNKGGKGKGKGKGKK